MQERTFKNNRDRINSFVLPALAFVLCILAPRTSHAQKQGQALIDSVLQVLPKAREDTNKVNLFNALAYTYFFINPDNGVKYGEQALALAQKLEWQKGIAIAYKNMGNAYMDKADYTIALEQYDKAITIFDSIHDVNNTARVLGNIGSVYDDLGDYEKALGYELRALKIYEHTGNKEGLARIYSELGNLYQTPKKYNEALGYFLKAYDINAASGDKQSLAIDIGNIGTCYMYLGNYDLAIDYDLRALAIYRELGDTAAIANKLQNISDVYDHHHDQTKALDYSFQALTLYEHVADKQAIGIAYASIGVKYFHMATDTSGNGGLPVALTPKSTTYLNKAIEYSLKAIELFKAIGATEYLYATYDALYQQYELAGNYKEAFIALKQASILKDSLFNVSKNVKFANLEKERALEQKKAADIKNEAQQKLNAEMQRHSRDRTILLSAGLLILLIAIVLVLRQRNVSEALLLNILPAKIAARLKKKERPIADLFENASVIFIDMSGFTKFAEHKNPRAVVSTLNDIFTKFDAIAEKHGLEKIKTIGDCYMAAAGLPEPNKNHAQMAAAMAMEVKTEMGRYSFDGDNIRFRIGLDCGSVVAGVIGKKKFIYDIWGDAVNTASRMESSGEPGEIHCTDNFKNNLTANYEFLDRGAMEIKGKGYMNTWFLTAIR